MPEHNRDTARQQRAERHNQSLFRVAKALHQFHRLDTLLEFITTEVRNIMAVDGASVILLDEKREEFYFPVAAYEDSETGRKFREVRFPADKGVAGQVYRTGKPLIVPDTAKCPHFYQHVDERTQYRTRNMLDVPLRIQDRMIGVLCTVNKKEGAFDAEDVELLSTVANMVALPIENTRIHTALRRSYERVKNLSRAKDRVMHHLSHELKTPVSVLSASLSLLEKRLSAQKAEGWKSILERARRNLDRLLEMQYQIEDILRGREYKDHLILLRLLDGCRDLLEALIVQNIGDEQIHERVGAAIETLFGPDEIEAEKIYPDQFVGACLEKLRPRFNHRDVRLITRFFSVPPVLLPRQVLEKIVTALVRNAVENTPDGGKIEVTVRNTDAGPELEVKDYGVGITRDKQRLIFDNYFTAGDPLQYASRHPYDFGAGGRGFDLLRVVIFSERYGFKTRMASKRCRFIPRETDQCPGRIDECDHCRTDTDCHDSGYTVMSVRFISTDA